MKNIVVTFVNPPIPIRAFDWSATYDDYQPGDIIGWGFTKEEAIQNLAEENDDE